MTFKPIIKLLLSIGLGLIACSVSAQFYNGSIMDFGKNRVQYRDFAWRYLRYQRFDCYYYQGGEELAAYCGKKINQLLPQMETMLEMNLDDRIQFIVYNSHTDFKQSNIGINDQEQSNLGGTTRIIGRKIFLFYQGDHRQLDQQIKSGIAQILVDEALYGGSLRDMVRNSALLHLPPWFTSGLLAYLANGSDAELDNRVRDGILSQSFQNFNQLEAAQAEIAGYSIWNYVAEVYGDKVIPNILYMTRISRSIESGFLIVLGLSLDQLFADYFKFYQERYGEEEKLRSVIGLDEIVIKRKKNRSYQQFQLSPNGQYVAYTSMELGQYRVYLKDLESGQTKQVAKGDHKLARLTDHSFPTLCWAPNSQTLAFTSEYKGKLQINLYFLEEKGLSSREVFQMDKILSMAYSNDGKMLALSGVFNGQTDLYKYYIIGNRQERLTDDIYEDLHPQFALNDQALLFASNRPSDTLNLVPARLAQANNDIFLLYLNNKSILERITQTPDDNESFPHEYGIRKYTYISNKNGLYNRFFAQADSTILSVDTTIRYTYYISTYALSNFNRSIGEYHLNGNLESYGLTAYQNDANRFFIGKIADDQVVSLSEMKISRLKTIKQINFDDPDQNKTLKNERLPNSDDRSDTDKPKAFKIINPEPSVPAEIDINNYQFGDTPPPVGAKPNKTGYSDTTAVVIPISPLNITPANEEQAQNRTYQLNFATDQVLTQVDNTFNNKFYQLLTGPDNINPGLSGFFKLGASDLFEDYKIVGGFRTSVNLNSMDYMLSFQNLRKRVDETFAAQRQNQLLSSSFSLFKLITYNGYYERKYPFSEVAAVKVTFSGRFDRGFSLSTDQFNLLAPNFEQYQVGSKLEYVYDNTLPLGTNLLSGTRMKAWYEYLRSPNEKNTNTQVAGVDIRHYQPLHRSLIFAGRFAASTSWGDRRVLYYLGGLDRWMYLPQSESSTPLPNDTRFYYQALASPFRGTLRNIRNGNSFAMINAEVRWPIAKYLSKQPLSSAFLESFQIVGFSDVGTAWTGLSPYSDDNQFNITNIPGNPVSARIRSQREPVVSGFGLGLRGRVLGYFLRADWAWSYQDGMVQARQFYLSLSLDF